MSETQARFLADQAPGRGPHRAAPAACAGQAISPLNAGPCQKAFCCRHWPHRSEEHTSELQSLMRISYAVFCLYKKKKVIKDECSTLLEYYTMKCSKSFAIKLLFNEMKKSHRAGSFIV